MKNVISFKSHLLLTVNPQIILKVLFGFDYYSEGYFNHFDFLEQNVYRRFQLLYY